LLPGCCIIVACRDAPTVISQQASRHIGKQLKESTVLFLTPSMTANLVSCFISNVFNFGILLTFAETGYLITGSGTWFLFQLLTKISPGFLADYIWSISGRDKQSCGNPTSIHPYDVAIMMWLTCLSVHI
jgi:hypothetical protein